MNVSYEKWSSDAQQRIHFGGTITHADWYYIYMYNAHNDDVNESQFVVIDSVNNWQIAV